MVEKRSDSNKDFQTIKQAILNLIEEGRIPEIKPERIEQGITFMIKRVEFRYGDVMYNCETRRLKVVSLDREEHLSQITGKVFLPLIRFPESLIGNERLVRSLENYGVSDGYSNLRNSIHCLRKIIDGQENLGKFSLIESIKGEGYVLHATPVPVR